MERLRTGSREADQILNGGFPTNSINIVMGQPGTGKTVFVQALAWHNANVGRPVLYCTTLAEPLPKLIRYLQQLDFFDPSGVGTSVFYDDLSEAVARQGLAGLNAAVRDLIKERRPLVLIVDSFKAAQELGGTDQDVRRMTFDLAGLLSAYDVTTFLIGEYHERDIGESPVFAAADGILELLRISDERRDERCLRVLKLRGSDYRSGLHGFTITSAGLRIHPRLAPDPAGAPAADGERIPTGVPGLDALTGGGFRDRAQSLLLGTPGAGKTTIAMQFLLEGARRGEAGLFVGFQESPEQLQQLIGRLDPSLGELERSNLEILHQEPIELRIEGIVSEVLARLRRGFLKRVVVDTVGELVAAAGSRERLHDCIYSLLRAFSANGASSILTAGAELGRDVAAARVEHLADNVILLEEYPGSPDRLRIRVRKCRFSSHERSSKFLELRERGARVVE